MLAVVLMTGISGAFVTNHAQASKKVDTFYNWTGASNSPQHPGATLNNATVTSATNFYGCNSGTNVCATGNKVSGPGPNNSTIFFQ